MLLPTSFTSRRFAALLVALLTTAGAHAEEYLRFRGITVEKNPGQHPAQLYNTGKRTVVRKYFQDLAAKEGTTVSLEQFSQRNWPHLKSEFERSRGKLEGRVAMLEEFTSQSETEKLSPSEFYDQVVAEKGSFPHFSNKEQWLIFQKNTPLKGAKQGPEEARQEHARRMGLLSQAAERLVLPQVVEEIEFGSPADRGSFLQLMEQELAMPLSPELPAEMFKNPQ